jgi:hypothetical protein
MNDSEFGKQMAELRGSISKLPIIHRESLLRLVKSTEDSYWKIEKIRSDAQQEHVNFQTKLIKLNTYIQDAVIGLKYLLFDMEARLREYNTDADDENLSQGFDESR